MGKRTNLVGFLADALNDSDLKNNIDNINIGLITSNSAPKRTSKPLTQLTVKNELSAILELSNKSKKKVNKKRMTKSAKKVKPIVKSAKNKNTKTKKRS